MKAKCLFVGLLLCAVSTYSTASGFAVENRVIYEIMDAIAIMCAVYLMSQL